jgi:7,8-dihydropterin-6-yl-methyl-4-(beta-D-ribofuranosyl)aminobenzene 5'-phosphate synthase
MFSVDNLKVTCLSETSWFDTGLLMSDIKKAGGMNADQYTINWDYKNAGGYSALVEYTKNYQKGYVLLDVGWRESYMDWVFDREVVIELLKNDKLNDVFVSHEHMDHFWGLNSITKIRNDFNLYIPVGFSKKGYEIIEKSNFKGNLIEVDDKFQNNVLSSFVYKIDIILGVKNEQILVFNLKDKGFVTITGCCHPGVNNMIDYVKNHYGDKLYGLYGGLHISLLEDWNEQKAKEIDKLASWGLEKVAANHCTGVIAVEHMIKKGINVIGGSAKFASQSKLYIGNTDSVEF